MYTILSDIARRTTGLILAVCLLAGSTGLADERAKHFALPALNGNTVRAEQFKDNIVILDFWATWCEPCIGEIPVLNSLEQKFASRGVKVIGVAVQSGWAKDINRFAKTHKMNYMILVGDDDTVSEFDVINFPTTFLIAPGWKVHKKYSGAYEQKGAEIGRDIEALLMK